MSERRDQVECVGLRCPEPVLRTARAARSLGPGGGLLEIQADDPAFPIDLKSWCRSSSAELVSLDEREQRFYAVVRVRPKAVNAANARPTSPAPAATPAQPAPAPPAPAAASAVAPASPAAIDAKLLDYRGRKCPEPITELAKAARTARGALEVLADDPAFLLDAKSWCRSSGATMEVISSDDSLQRVLIYPKGSSRDVLAETMASPAAAPARASAPPQPPSPPPTASPAPPVPPAPAAAASPPPSPFPAGIPTARFDLRDLPPDALDAELAQIGRLRPGTGITLNVPASLGQRAVRWCVASGHELLAYSGGDQLDVLLVKAPEPARDAAIVPAGDASAYDCVLFVLHSDLESVMGALLVANIAAAAGQRVMIFFTFWGLNLLRADRVNAEIPAQPVSFMQRMFKWMMPRGPRRQGLGKLNFGGMGPAIMGGIMERNNIRNLPELFASAKEQRVTFVACTTSMAVMGITQRELEPYSELQLGGVASFVEAARRAQLSLVF